jgi:hypothetical protein
MELINSRIFLQAEHIKHHLKNKTSSRTSTHPKNEDDPDLFSKSHSRQTEQHLFTLDLTAQ